MFALKFDEIKSSKVILQSCGKTYFSKFSKFYLNFFQVTFNSKNISINESRYKLMENNITLF